MVSFRNQFYSYQQGTTQKWKMEYYNIYLDIHRPHLFLSKKQVRVTLKSSSEQRVRFYSLERSSPLLDIGHKTWDMGYGIWDMGHGT